MASKIVYQRTGGGKGSADIVLVAGLEWRVLSADTPAALRERGQERSATHVALIRPKSQAPTHTARRWPWQRATQQDHESSESLAANTALPSSPVLPTATRPVAGFFVNLDGTAPPAKAHSLAAAFAGWMAAHPTALLCYALSATERQGLHPPPPEGTWLVVVVVAGSPVVDTVVTNGDEAHALTASYLVSHPGISIVSNDTVRYPQTVKADNILPALVNFALTSADGATRLRAIPADTRKWVVMTLIAALATGAYLYYQKSQQEAERQRVLQERRTNDPAQLYAAALRTQAPRMGFSRASLVDAVDSIARLPLRTHGWQLKSVQCEASCTALYLRQFGTRSDLSNALQALGPGYTLQAPLATASDLDTATVLVPATLDPTGPEPIAPTQVEFLQSESADQLQNWKTAGLALQINAPQLWPQVPNVPTSFKGANALGVGTFEVGGIALPLLKEVIKTAPSNVIWKGFRLEMTAGSASANPLDLAKARAFGVFYVKQ